MRQLRNDNVFRIIRSFGIMRLVFAAICGFAPRVAISVVGYHRRDASAVSDHFAGMTATRAAALGILEYLSGHLDHELRRPLLLLLAAVDAVDTAMCVIRGMRAKRLMPILAGTPFGMISVPLQVVAALRTD